MASVTKIMIIMLEALRICLYMRCFGACIGKYRVSRKMAASAFTVLWIFESFLVSVSDLGPWSSLMDFSFFIVEIPFLLAMSFCCKGSMARRLLMTVFLPAVYWFGKWGVGSVLFKTIQDGFQYAVTTAVSNVLLCIFELTLEKAGKSRQERERELLEQEIRIYENQFAVIRQSQDHIRSLKHDMKHHIKMLTDMVSGGENDAALRYLTSMGAFMENSQEYVASENEKIDSILNYMISQAKRSGIEVSWKIQIPERLDIPAFDINVILSNLLENALHALEGLPGPSLDILMKYDRGVLCISTRNPCAQKGPVSADAGEHGLGLKNIRRIAEKYHGSLTASVQDGIFHANVLLFLKEEDNLK